jgi:hypothetical protein
MVAAHGGWARLVLAWLVLVCALGPVRVDGADPDTWARIQAARVRQSAAADPAGAAVIYQSVLAGLPEDDPLRAEVLYWLGRAWFEAGDRIKAREALLQAALFPRSRTEARAWLGWMDLEERRVGRLPYEETFEAGFGAWVRGWGRGAEDDLTLANRGVDGRPALAWRVQVADGEDDFLAMGLAPGAGTFESVRFSARADAFEAWLLVVVVDHGGRRWLAPGPSRIQTGEWREITVALDSLNLSEAPTGMRLDPATVRRVELVDVTAFNSRNRGDHWVFFDTITLD